MRTLAITQNITLDGSIEMLGDWFEPSGRGDLSDLDAHLAAERDQADAFLVGRTTFEAMRSFWPHQTDDTTGVSAYLDEVSKYVVSGTLTEPRWPGTTVLSGEPVEEVRALKEQPGGDIVVTGSITLCHALIPSGLVDEYRLYAYPVVQGRGRRLFPDGYELPRLDLLAATTFDNGVAGTRYAAR